MRLRFYKRAITRGTDNSKRIQEIRKKLCTIQIEMILDISAISVKDSIIHEFNHVQTYLQRYHFLF